MKNRRVENMLSDAIDIVQSVEIADKDGVVKNEFMGYVSSYGVSVRQNGLIGATLFFSDKNSQTNEKRHLIIDAIFKLMCQRRYIEEDEYLDLIEYSLENNGFDERKLIYDCANAIKQAIRVYKIDKGDTDAK